MKKFTLTTYSILLFASLLTSLSSSYDDVQSITITKEDIINAKPTKQDVNFTSKERKAIEVMEKRHFERTYPELSDFERLKNLEYELLGQPWVYSPQKERIDTLKIASSNRMISGMALPPCIGKSRRTARRLQNDAVPMRKKDDVGLIDGFLRLLAPDLYESYREQADNLYYKYTNEY